MCVWGGKLEAYQLPQRSGKEAFLSEGSEQLGGWECCSHSERREWLFSRRGNVRVATAGKDTEWEFPRGNYRWGWGGECAFGAAQPSVPGIRFQHLQ